MKHTPTIAPAWTALESIDYSEEWADISEDLNGDQVAELFFRVSGADTFDYPRDHISFDVYEVAGVRVTEGADVIYYERERLMSLHLVPYKAICAIEDEICEDKIAEAS